MLRWAIDELLCDSALLTQINSTCEALCKKNGCRPNCLPETLPAAAEHGVGEPERPSLIGWVAVRAGVTFP